MARPLRVEYPGALYHITSRGNARQDIYLLDLDRTTFLQTLADTIETHNWICHAYCLMGNHYHLLVETPDGNLSRGMRDLNGVYTQKFNQSHRRNGHIFQGRYKAFIIEKEGYLQEVARYIVLNPVRAKIAAHPRLWRWSSYKATAGEIATPAWLRTDLILGMFGKKVKSAQRAYRAFVHAGFGLESPFHNLKTGCILGSPQFINWIWQKTSGVETIKEIPRVERMVGRPTLEELFDKADSKQERDAAIRLARTRCGYLTTEIAAFLKIDRSTVGKISRKSHIPT
jgi:REP element-mobilizing transposase RayT